MNVLTPAPTARAAPGASAVLPVTPAAVPASATTLQFERALQQIVLGGVLTTAAPTGLPLANAPSQTPSDFPAPALALAETVTGEAEEPVTTPDLLLSGLLLQAAPPMPMVPVAPAVPGAPAASPVAGIQPAGLASLPLPALPASAPSASVLAPSTAVASAVPPATIGTPPATAMRSTVPLKQVVAVAADTALLSSADITLPAAATGTDVVHRPAATAASAPAAAAPTTLMDALGERIASQLQRGSERVVIRLDPPLQGHIEVSIRRDAVGATQVHLSGSSGELVRQLQTISDGLRQELVQRQAGDVSVHVGHAMREQDGRQQRQDRQAFEQDTPGRALGDAHDEATSQRFALSADRDGR